MDKCVLGRDLWIVIEKFLSATSFSCLKMTCKEMMVLNSSFEYDGKIGFTDACVLEGNFDLLKWYYHQNYNEDLKKNAITCSLASGEGNLEILKWLRKKGFAWDEETCTLAAYKGNLECLKWARENGCPWNNKTINIAAKRGNFECLKWAYENDLKFDINIFENAIEGGNLDCVKWLKSKRECSKGMSPCFTAARHGQLEILKWLKKRRICVK